MTVMTMTMTLILMTLKLWAMPGNLLDMLDDLQIQNQMDETQDTDVPDFEDMETDDPGSDDSELRES
jgi:hypothetical protein